MAKKKPKVIKKVVKKEEPIIRQRLVREDNVESMKEKGYKKVKDVYDKRSHMTSVLMKKA